MPCYLLSVSNSLCFSSIYRSLGRTSTAAYYWFNTQYRTSDVAENLGKHLSGAQCIQPSGKTGVILTIKMENIDTPSRNHLEVNFRRSVIIAELWRPEVARSGNFVSIFCVFFGKTTPYGKIFKILFRKFSPCHRSTLLC